jgi:BlaI family transcriptional regulator, penicillinase repressor
MTRRPPLHHELSRRERQIMDAVHASGTATVQDVVERLGEEEARDSVRVTLAILEKKGHLRHRRDGNRNVYYPAVPRSVAQRSAMQHLASTFFDGSASRAILAFLDQSAHRLTREELDEIGRRIEERGGKR